MVIALRFKLFGRRRQRSDRNVFASVGYSGVNILHILGTLTELFATTVGAVLFVDETCNEEGQNIKEVVRFDQTSIFLSSARRI